MPKTIQIDDRADIFERIKEITSQIIDEYRTAEDIGDEELEDFCCLPHDFDIWPDTGMNLLTVSLEFNDANSEYLFSVPPTEMKVTIIGYNGLMNSDMLGHVSTGDFLNEESVQECISQALLEARDYALDIPETEAKEQNFYHSLDYAKYFDFSGAEACIQGETKQTAKERGQQADGSIHIEEKSETSLEPEKN